MPQFDIGLLSPYGLRSHLDLTNEGESPQWQGREPEKKEKQLIYSKQSSRILFNSVGAFCYIGDSSPLSLLTVCRDIFRDELGKSKFTEDPERIHIVEKQLTVSNNNPINLPTKEVCLELLKLFDENINQTFYILNIEHFKSGVVDFVYDNPLRAKKNHMSLLYLVLALGLLFKKASFGISQIDEGDITPECFFQEGYKYVTNLIDDTALWITESYFLAYFYLQTSNKRNPSWFALGCAIRHAQTLGLHRKYVNESFTDKDYIIHRRKLWRSLYICEKASSILLGRPFIISDNDWDDSSDNFGINFNDLDAVCLIETTKAARINGKIVRDFYLNGIVDGSSAEKLADELKSWSNNLIPLLQINRVLSEKDKTCPYSFIFMHLTQMYGICLLTKPFLLYAVKNSIKTETENSQLTNFYESSVKSAVLTIQLLSFYLNTGTKRVELYISFNCCFISALILGMTVVHLKKTGFNSSFKVPYLIRAIEKSNMILSYYGTFNEISKRYSVIITYMVEALGTSATSRSNDLRSGGILDHDLSSMQHFQNCFVPSIPLPENEISPQKDDFSVFMYKFGTNDFIINNDF